MTAKTECVPRAKVYCSDGCGRPGRWLCRTCRQVFCTQRGCPNGNQHHPADVELPELVPQPPVQTQKIGPDFDPGGVFEIARIEAEREASCDCDWRRTRRGLHHSNCPAWELP